MQGLIARLWATQRNVDQAFEYLNTCKDLDAWMADDVFVQAAEAAGVDIGGLTKDTEPDGIEVPHFNEVAHKLQQETERKEAIAQIATDKAKAARIAVQAEAQAVSLAVASSGTPASASSSRPEMGLPKAFADALGNQVELLPMDDSFDKLIKDHGDVVTYDFDLEAFGLKVAKIEHKKVPYALLGKMAHSLRRGAHATLRNEDGWALLYHLPGKLHITHAHLKDITAQDIVHSLWDKQGKNTSFKLGVLTPGSTPVASPGLTWIITHGGLPRASLGRPDVPGGVPRASLKSPTLAQKSHRQA
jgi:hypothetical protein